MQHAATATIHTPPNWHEISTGLEKVHGQDGTFEAADFDVLYSPILTGNQEHLEFDEQGVPHYIALEKCSLAG